MAGSLNRDKIVSGILVYIHCSVFKFLHSVNSSLSFDAWLGMVEPHWKRLGAVEIVPEWVEMIKTEKVEIENGWKMGGAGV